MPIRISNRRQQVDANQPALNTTNPHFLKERVRFKTVLNNIILLINSINQNLKSTDFAKDIKAGFRFKNVIGDMTPKTDRWINAAKYNLDPVSHKRFSPYLDPVLMFDVEVEHPVEIEYANDLFEVFWAKIIDNHFAHRNTIAYQARLFEDENQTRGRVTNKTRSLTDLHAQIVKLLDNLRYDIENDSSRGEQIGSDLSLAQVGNQTQYESLRDKLGNQDDHTPQILSIQIVFSYREFPKNINLYPTREHFSKYAPFFKTFETNCLELQDVLDEEESESEEESDDEEEIIAPLRRNIPTPRVPQRMTRPIQKRPTIPTQPVPTRATIRARVPKRMQKLPLALRRILPPGRVGTRMKKAPLALRRILPQPLPRLRPKKR